MKTNRRLYMSFRNEFKDCVICLTGRVMTVYDHGGHVMARHVYGNTDEAERMFRLMSRWESEADAS